MRERGIGQTGQTLPTSAGFTESGRSVTAEKFDAIRQESLESRGLSLPEFA
jgi:hypothetical protein